MEPAPPQYRLEVRQNGKTHTVSWAGVAAFDGVRFDPDAERLRELTEKIHSTFLAKPDVKRIPRPSTICL